MRALTLLHVSHRTGELHKFLWVSYFVLMNNFELLIPGGSRTENCKGRIGPQGCPGPERLDAVPQICAYSPRLDASWKKSPLPLS